MSFDERIVNGLRVLVAIVDSGSFIRAGDILDMSQSGVSRSVARLETRLGIRLFDRTTRSITLTDEGRRFYEQILPLLAGLEEAATSAAEGARTVRGRLRVNIDPLFSRLILGPRLGAFLQQYPQLQLELVTRDQLGDMVADGFDLAIRFGVQRPSSLVARKLLETRIITVAAPAYLKKHGKPASPHDLESGKHICIKFREPESGRPYPWEFHQGKKRIELMAPGQLTVNDVGTLLSVCTAGFGIGQILGMAAEQLLADGRLIDIFPDWADELYPLYALYPSRHLPSAKTVAFLELVTSLSSQPV
ncbi:MAG TPA: LysR family transcriptional regulator [Methylophilaceae bacterium]|jgi:DNA-binding transcriptional LysR family regulator